jgi:hypothetical protein
MAARSRRCEPSLESTDSRSEVMIDLGGWATPDSGFSLAAAALFQEAVREKCIWFLRKTGGESYRT